MWKCGVLAEAAKNSALNPESAKRRRTVAGKLVLRHAFARAVDGGPISGDSQVVRFLHERQLRRRLEHAAACGHRRGAHELQNGRGLANAIKQKKAHAFFDS